MSDPATDPDPFFGAYALRWYDCEELLPYDYAAPE